jgi:lactoylglutathione lyase
MKIDHIAIWVRNLEEMKTFYEQYFGARSNHRYHNPLTHFESYFLSFEGGSRLELMHRPDIAQRDHDHLSQREGIVHMAISAGSEEKVDELVNTLRSDGHRIVGQPRMTGDGYYEAVVLDPEGNLIEVTA